MLSAAKHLRARRTNPFPCPTERVSRSPERSEGEASPCPSHLPLWLRCKGLVDLPEGAFGIGKVCRAQSPALVGWGSQKRDSLGHQRLVGCIDILNTGS